jgi:hypothetical protein
MSIPVWTMFHVPRAGDEYSRPDLNGAGKFASAILTCGISSALNLIFCFSFTFFNIIFNCICIYAEMSAAEKPHGMSERDRR